MDTKKLIKLATLLLFFVYAPASWSITLSGPSTDTDGTFTLTWGACSGCDDYQLQERNYTANGSWITIHEAGGYSKTVTGKLSSTWHYRIRGCEEDDGQLICGSWSSVKSVVVSGPPPAVPPVPATPTAPSADTDGSFTVSWNSVSGATIYDLWEKEPGEGWNGGEYYGPATSKALTRSNGLWQYKVRACNASYCSNFSGVKTVEVTDPPATPATPTGPTTDSDGTYTISWSSISGANKYQLQEKLNSGSWLTIHDASGLSKSRSGLAEGTWSYRVNACETVNGASVCGSWSNTKTVDVISPPVAPAAPTGPSVHYVGPYTISWNSVASATSYYLEEQEVNENWNGEYNGPATSKTIPGRNNGPWKYRVRACNAAGCSDWSSITTVQVEDPPVPGATTGLTGPITSDDGSISLDWTLASGVIDYQELQQSLDGASPTTSNVASSAITHSLTNLDSGNYRYRVRACNNPSGCGDYSDWFDVVVSQTKTTADIPSTNGIPNVTTGDADPGTVLGDVFNGSINGVHGVNEAGAATYTVPIIIPPGTNGIQPTLALNYNSQNGNGLLGRGWSLGGVGMAISRCGQTIAQNDNIHSVDYSSDDRFCLNGQQLIVESTNTYGADDAEYRTELDSFSRITSHTTSGTEPDSFTVETKSGLIMEFGNTTDSFIEAQGKTVARLWLLNRVMDQHGNYYDIHYEEDNPTTGNGEYRPDYVEYTGYEDGTAGTTNDLAPYARVDFVYESRTDIIPRYFAGSKSQRSKRLANIKTYIDSNENGVIETANDAEMVRDYQLVYEDADVTDFPRLISLKQCVTTDGTDDDLLADCTLATTFDWIAEDNDYVINTWTTSAPAAGALQQWADFNGDGRMDYITSTSSSSTHYVSLAKSDASGYETADPWTAYQKGNGYFETFADLNGDGKADYFTVDDDGEHYWSVSTGSGYTNDSYFTGHNVSSTNRQHLADMNGDGLPDYLLVTGTNHTNTVHTVRINDGGSGYLAAQTWASGPDLSADGLDAGTYNLHDVNGDGRTDIVKIRGSDPDVHEVYINTDDVNGDGTKTDPGYIKSNWSAVYDRTAHGHWADLNGDGRLDYIIIDNVDDTKHQINFSTGTGYVGETWTAYSVGTSGMTEFRDMNGDGLSDFVTLTGSSHQISLSTGSGYTNQSWTGAAISSSGAYDFVDMDGDGKPDYVTVSTSGSHTVGISQCASVHLMTKVTDGLGVETEYTYKNLTDTSVYTKGTTATYPEMDVVNAGLVVSDMTHSNGIGGTFSSSYHYEGFRFDREGRGSLGFATVTVTDQTQNKTTITDYNQTWPYTGLVELTEVYVTDIDGNALNNPDRLISSSDPSYVTEVSAAPFDATAPAANQSRFPAMSNRIEELFDLGDGGLLSTTNTDNQCDSYGNITQTVVAVTDHEDVVGGYDTVHETTTDNTYTNNTSDWLLGQLTRRDVTPTRTVGNSLQSDTAYNRRTDFTYTTEGELYTVIREPTGAAAEKLTTTYSYDQFGNRTDEQLSASGINTRSESVTYDSRGRYPTTLTNALLDDELRQYDMRFGVVTKITDPNGLVIDRGYDNIGRLIEEERPDGTITTNAYRLDTSGNTTNAKVYTETDVTGGTPLRTIYDQHGREIRRRIKGFDGTFIQTDTEYDERGRVLKTSQPYYIGETIIWTTQYYDELNRVIDVSAADASEDVETVYDGFKVTTTDALLRETEQTKNAVGQVVKVVDDTGNSTEYEYDFVGNQTTVKQATNSANSQDLTHTYDRLGRKLSTEDPDAGLIKFQYNALGEVTRQQTPRLRAAETTPWTVFTKFTYDDLGRIETRTEPHITTLGAIDTNKSIKTTWDYDDDSIGNLGIGKIASEKVELVDGLTYTTQFLRTYTYSDMVDYADGKLTDTVTTIDNTDTYTHKTRYDSAGRVSKIIYPISPSYPTSPDVVPFEVHYTYNIRGYLERVADDALNPTTIYYQTTAMDAEGRVTEHYLGDGSLTNLGYITGSDRLAYTNSAIDDNSTKVEVQNLSYTYDGAANLKTRSELLNSLGLIESFDYDDLNRLTGATVTHNGLSVSTDYGYTELGNMKYKSDFSDGSHLNQIDAFSYGTQNTINVVDAGNHAVTSVSLKGSGTENYEYDDNGNLVESNNRDLTWTSFDKPASIIDGSITRTFAYGPDRLRYKQTHSGGTTHYIGGLYELVKDGSAEKHRHFIRVNGQVIAVHIDDQATTPDSVVTKYWHRDHLGSITAIVYIDDMDNIQIETLSYDAFGKRRDEGDWQGDSSNTPSEVRGYTGHEHLDDLDIIHMNGRIYDPNMGRMLSPDPIVQAPLNGQNYNRYSYVFNNPNKYTDPTGYWGGFTFHYAAGGFSAAFGNWGNALKFNGDYTDNSYSVLVGTYYATNYLDYLAEQWGYDNYDTTPVDTEEEVKDTEGTDMTSETSTTPTPPIVVADPPVWGGWGGWGWGGGWTDFFVRQALAEEEENEEKRGIPIIPRERAFLAANDVEGFYSSRLARGDVYGRTALGVVRNNTTLGRAANAQLLLSVTIATLDGEISLPANSTEQFLRQVNIDLAFAHAESVTDDYDRSIGNVGGLLSPGQIQDYHEEYFESIGISGHTFGGATFGLNNSFFVPWCTGCDVE